MVLGGSAGTLAAEGEPGSGVGRWRAWAAQHRSLFDGFFKNRCPDGAQLSPP